MKLATVKKRRGVPLSRPVISNDEGLFQAFTDNLPGAAWIKDLEGCYVFANRTMARMMRTSRSKIVGRRDRDLWPKETVAQFRRNDHEVLKTGLPTRVVETTRDQRRTRSMLVIKFPVRDHTGAIIGVAGIGIEITELLEAQQALADSEARYRRLVEASPDLIGVAVQGRVAFINSAGARMLGVTRPSRLQGRPVLGFVHPSFRRQAAANVRRIVGAGQPVPFGLEIWQRLDGTPINVELSAFPHHYQNQPAVFIVARDVTARFKAEQQLNEYARQFRDLSLHRVEIQENERRYLARELHDEMGQELTALQMSLQMAARQNDPLLHAQALRDALQLLDGLIQQTQNMSFRLRPSMLDDLGLVSALRWLLAQQASRATLRAVFRAQEFPRRLEPELETACFRIAQEAITNVLRHACARRLTVQLLRHHRQLHLVVADDGIGWKKRQVPANRPGTPQLGLLGMQERAGLVGGRVEFRPHGPTGTEVHAWLPLRWRNTGRALKGGGSQKKRA